MNMSRIAITALFFLNAVFFLYPNTGGYISTGAPGTVMPYYEKRIQMVEEAVNISVDIDPKSGWYFPRFIYSYSCVYSLKNTSRDRVEILLGYPYQKRPPLENDFNVYMADDLKLFSVTVNEIPVKFERKTQKFNPALPSVAYDEAITFRAVFEPNETKSIKTSCAINATGIHGGLLSDIVDESVYRIPDLYPPHGTVGPFVLHYILKSGKTWKQPIGKSRINIDFNLDPDMFSIRPITLSGFKRTVLGTKEKRRTLFSAVFTDLTPNEDIEIGFALNEELFLEENGGRLNDLLKTALGNKDVGWLKWLLQETAIRIQLPSSIDYDLLRRCTFLTGNRCYSEKAFLDAFTYFQLAMFFSAKNMGGSFEADINFDQVFTAINDQGLLDWKDEGRLNAPSDYIAYNAACACSLFRQNYELMDEGFDKEMYSYMIDNVVMEGLEALAFAVKLNGDHIKPLALKDKDLAFLKEKYPTEFDEALSP